MPAILPLQLGKRSHEDDDARGSAKRQAVDPAIVNGGSGSEYWMVQWRHPQTKKHKTWDGDGVLVASISKATLYDMEGKLMTTGKVELPLSEGKNLTLGGKELELDCAITEKEFLSGSCFGRMSNFASTPTPPNPVSSTTSASLPLSSAYRTPFRDTGFKAPTKFKPAAPTSSQSPITNSESHWMANWRKQQSKKNKTWDGDAYISCADGKFTMLDEKGKVLGAVNWGGGPPRSGMLLYIGNKEVQLDTQILASQLPGARAPRAEASDVPSAGSTLPFSPKAVPPSSFYANPIKTKPKGPRHDPDADGAVVMKTPTQEHIKSYNKHKFPVVPVVLDPTLSLRMRAHQHEGVKFMYETVMGMRDHEGQGCILADDMGLGKTLQTIALIWTLLKQNPYAAPSPVVSKVLIVCPVSLINNWKAEFYKWLGRDRVGIVVCDKDKKAVHTFMSGKQQHVLIIGYERLRTVIDDLAVCIPPIGLIVCDEGHRLKSANNKTTQMFKSLRTARRIILSGTPIQNDLSEFHTMADFCNPGLLDEYPSFRRLYEVPILKSRAPDATAAEIKLGEARSAQLHSVAQSFVLRRDASLLKALLPPKHEYVLFVTPTSTQLSIFIKILHPDKVDDIVRGSSAESLALINLLTKVSNSPILLKATIDKARANATDSIVLRSNLDTAASLLPERAQIHDMSLSGKLLILSKLLTAIRQHTDEKCVLVSHYTSTLNILEAYCKHKSYSYYRLDGQTPASKRQEFVSAFNKSNARSSFIFLLSSKAGGVGINLIGASRLCLLDCDWNPSHDLQSMARCHRDGQTKPVHIYRFLTTGTIDEKIYQRQVTKLGLSDSLIGKTSSGSKSDTFTKKDLRDIFRIHPNTPCNTHDLLGCHCDSEVGSSRSEEEPDFPQEILEDDDQIDDSDRVPRHEFIVASEVRGRHVQEPEDQAYLQQKKAGLKALSEWSHINCLKHGACDEIHDDILRKIARPHSSGEESKGNASGDNDGVGPDGQAIIKSGVISFIFQRTSTSITEEADDVPSKDVGQHQHDPSSTDSEGVEM